MSDIKVNKIVWDAISAVDKRHIITHLRQYGVLKPEQNIVADAHTPPPFITPHSKNESGDDDSIQALGIDWTCRAICDSTKAETNCALYGQALSSCLLTICDSRESVHSGFEKS